MSRKDSVYLLQILAEKGRDVSKEKLQWSLGTVHYLGHDWNPEGIYLSSKGIKLSQEFPISTTKQQLSTHD